MARITGPTPGGEYVFLETSEWSTVRLALVLAALRFRENAASGFTRRADDCDKLVQFIDDEGLL